MTEERLVQLLAEEINGGNYGGAWTGKPYPYSKFRPIAKHIMDELAKEKPTASNNGFNSTPPSGAAS